MSSPVNTLLLALASGVAAALKPIVTTAIDQGYQALTSYLSAHYPEVNLGTLEEIAQTTEPSGDTPEALAAAAQDPEVQRLAAAVLAADPETQALA